MEYGVAWRPDVEIDSDLAHAWVAPSDGESFAENPKLIREKQLATWIPFGSDW